MSSQDPRIAYFDALALRWEEEEPSSRTMIDCLQRHADLLALQPGQALLEVGCGTGKTTAWLAERVAPGRVTAVDFAPAMVEQARAKAIDADFRCLDVCADELGPKRFDVVLCFHSFPHFRDQAGALERFAGALKPEGRLIVMHLAGSEQINRFHSGLDGPVRNDALPSASRWAEMLQATGLDQTGGIDREDLFFLEAVRRP